MTSDLKRLVGRLKGLRRRSDWIEGPPAAAALSNGARNALALAIGRETAGALPSMLKVDISPVCALACPHCLHADPLGRGLPVLAAQRFSPLQRMSVEAFGRLVDAVAGRTVAVSLYYYGDPLTHPDLDAIIRRARQARLSVHITSHMSYALGVARLRSLVESGLSHLTVAIDGATQESYGVTRVRGRLDFVLGNLRRLLEIRNGLGRVRPIVEVQHLRFDHHPPGEEERVRAIARSIGADRFKTYRGLRHNSDGTLYNVVEDAMNATESDVPRPSRGLPYCSIPWSSAVIRYDGEVIPCCLWRVGTQYAEGGDPHSLGNVFNQGLEAIWNGPAYRAIRRKVMNPARESGTFCDGCPKLSIHAEAERADPERAFVE